MPLPKTTNVGKIMHKLKKEGGRPHKQMVAIALEQARKSGKIKGVDKRLSVMKARSK